MLEQLASGKSVALVSDAGTPLISDPGWRLVSAAQAAGIAVVPVPGSVRRDRGVVRSRACRPITSCSRDSCRGAKALALRGSMRCGDEQRTIVFYEAVHRVAETLAALRAAFGGERRAAIARELTKTHEQIATGTLAELAARIDASIPLLGEFVIVVAGRRRAAPDEAEARRVYALLAAELRAGQGAEARGRHDRRSRATSLYRLMRT